MVMLSQKFHNLMMNNKIFVRRLLNKNTQIYAILRYRFFSFYAHIQALENCQ